MRTFLTSSGPCLAWYACPPRLWIPHAEPVTQSWSPRNLFNLWQQSIGPKQRLANFRKSNSTLFQSRWRSKALVRAYHGDYINEKTFKRWYLPATLPDVRPRRSSGTADAVGLARWARKDSVAEQEERLREEEDAKGLAPVGSLMLAEVERRIDVVIFRACLASSVYEARRLVIHGDVLLNGKKVRAGHLLNSMVG